MVWPPVPPEAEGSIWRHSRNVQVPCAVEVVSLQLVVCLVPYIDQLVPAVAGSDRVAATGREADTSHPLRMARILDGTFAYTQNILPLDGFVYGARDNLQCYQRLRPH